MASTNSTLKTFPSIRNGILTAKTTPAWADWRTNPESATPTDSKLLVNQPKLPNLPIPELDVTLSRLLLSAAPLAESEHEMKELERKVASFGNGFGKELHTRLQDRRAQAGMRSWIAEWWDTLAYTTYRDSVVVNVSYYYGFRKFPQSPPSLPSINKNDPAYVAASITTIALEYRRLIAKGLLEPDSAGKGKGELCMESFKWLYNACRIPCSPADYGSKISEDSPEGQHLIAIHKNNFYSIALVDKNGTEFTTEEFKRAFQNILDRSDVASAGVGILTGINRDTWSEAHAHLIEVSPTNAATLASIRTSAFVVCLDEFAPNPSTEPISTGSTTTSSEGIRDFASRIWKTGGKGIGEGEAKNRWFDKPLQWIVFSNGESGFVGEHAFSDGGPTARLNDFLSQRLLNDSPSKVGVDHSSAILPETTPLKFVLDEQSLTSIKNATKEFSDHVGAYDLHHFNFGRYGKDGIKAMKVSPDGWVQQMFQLAYYLQHSKGCGTYEAAQVRTFQLGRTETVRSCNSQSLAWCKSMVDGTSSNAEKIKLFRSAVSTQGADMKLASSGLGVDRHLFGLKQCIKEGETTELFSDPLLTRSGTWKMSTSQIYIREGIVYGWGPVANDGYGIPYMIHPESLQFTVTCRNEMPGAEFAANLELSGNLLMDLMMTESKL